MTTVDRRIDVKIGSTAFTIEEGEYAYLIQELKPKTNWQVILLQIFALLAAIALVGVVWILFEPLCREIFDLIYN